MSEDIVVTLAKQIVVEETDKLEKEIIEDVNNLMNEWGDRLLARIMARTSALGIVQDLSIQVTWDPQEMPEFKFIGETRTGVCNEHN